MTAVRALRFTIVIPSKNVPMSCLSPTDPGRLKTRTYPDCRDARGKCHRPRFPASVTRCGPVSIGRASDWADKTSD